MANIDSYKSIMFFVIKISFLVGIYYYFSDQINFYANASDWIKATAYSGVYAGVILVLILLFRWSGFFARLLAGLSGIAALAAVVGLHIYNHGFGNVAFIGAYCGILFVSVMVGYMLLYKKI